MAPLQSSLTCSVCDDELSSVSTLHYHQMCLHTTEELSLAILSLRELPVNPTTPVGDGGTTGNVSSPSTDCEDMLLRNGLAKYPRFLLASGGRKPKPVISENTKRSIDDEKDTPNKQVKDKENILRNKCTADKSVDRSDDNSSVVDGSISNDKQLAVKSTAESVRSRLWGAIKTLDGKAVDAPIVKIDGRRSVLKPNYISEKDICKISKSLDKANSRIKNSDDSSQVVSTDSKKNNGESGKKSCNSHRVGTETSIEHASDQECTEELHSRQGDIINDCQNLELKTESNEQTREGHESEGSSEKGKLLEKQLQMMNMSSFDDVIELECSDDSDDEREPLSTEKLHSEGQGGEKEVGENCSEDEILAQVGKGKRVRAKPQKHRSWYSGSNVKNIPSSVSNCQEHTIVKSDVKQKPVDAKANKDLKNESILSDERDPLVSKVEISSTVAISNKHNPSEVQAVGVNKQDNKVYLDSGVQTDDFLAENSDDENSQNSCVDKCQDSKDIVEDRRKISPKKKHNKRKHPKNQKDANFGKNKKVMKREKISVGEENLPMDGDIRVKPELVDVALHQSRGIMVNGEKRFFCDQCNKTYKKRSHLERHKRVHTGERPFICSYCEKGFSVRSILNQHIRIHTGEKPYSCTICAARFPQKSGLMTHMMLHTGKPFKCDQCDKSFVSNHKLLHHLKGHDGDRPHSCDECKSAFFTAAALSDHKLMHSRSRKHICNKCRASFVHEVYLKIHLASHLLEAECVESVQPKLTDSMSSHPSSSPQSNPLPGTLTLTLDAIDQFCNGETIMMDLSV